MVPDYSKTPGPIWKILPLLKRGFYGYQVRICRWDSEEIEGTLQNKCTLVIFVLINLKKK